MGAEAAPKPTDNKFKAFGGSGYTLGNGSSTASATSGGYTSSGNVLGGSGSNPRSHQDFIGGSNPRASSGAAGNPRRTQEDEDAALARRLQEEFDREGR